MAYNATSMISDKSASTRARTLYLLLAKTMTEINQAPELISEFRSMVYHISKTKENLLDVSSDKAKQLANRINGHLDGGQQNAEEMIAELEASVEEHQKRQRFILSQLSEHEAPWNNRSILIECGANPHFHRFDKEKGPVVDNEKVARVAYDEICKHINPSRFRIMLLGRTSPISRTNDSVTSAIITFSEADEPLFREAMLKITEDHLSRSKEQFNSRSYDKARELADTFPYQFATGESRVSSGKLTISMLREEDPATQLSRIPLQEQFVLMDIERYADQCPKLKAFVDDEFGGAFGKTEEGFRRAMGRCMELYLNEKSVGVNVDKLMQALDREMEAAATFQKLTPTAMSI